MNEQSSEARAEIQEIREYGVRLVSESYGELMDVLDEFLSYGVKWHDDFQKVVPLDAEHWQDPIVSRDIALSMLLAESLAITLEISTLLRSGLVRPAMTSLRKLYETHIDARFMELDLSGSVAYRWMHWGVANRAKLRPDDENAQKDYATSKKIFENEKGFGRHGSWAKMPNGKMLKDLPARAQYVNRLNAEGVGQPWIAAVANKRGDELLAKTNAQAHPNIAGNESPFSLDIIIFLTAHYTFFTLLAYKNGLDDHREFMCGCTRGERLFSYPSGNYHLIQLGKQIHESYLQIYALIVGQIERDEQSAAGALG